MFNKKILFVVLAATFSFPSFAKDTLYYGTGSDVLGWIRTEFKRVHAGGSQSGSIKTQVSGTNCVMSYDKLSKGVTRFLISDLTTNEIISIDISSSEKIRYTSVDAGAQHYATAFFPNNENGIDAMYFEFDDPSYYFRITMKRGKTTVSCHFDG